MCGIFAAIDDVWGPADAGVKSPGDIPLLNDHEKNENNKALSDTCKKLYHRGPDGMTVASGTIGNTNGQGARWAMGHTRLAIVDPENRMADMPFQLDFKNGDEETKIIKMTGNGEIYNHEVVYKNLVENDSWPHDKISASDCEVIAHCFAKHGGPETVKRLDGMFAFVIFEENTKDGSVRAFAARDHVGIKPIYYGRTMSVNSESDKSMGGYVFSSELKALVGHVEPSTVVAIPPGHYWTPEEGLVCYYNPEWLRKVRNIQVPFLIKDNPRFIVR